MSPIRAALRRQADICGRLGSPFTERLLFLLADWLREDTPVGNVVLNWPADPGEDALALRLAGALHALVLSRQSPDLVDVYPPARPVGGDRLWQAVDGALDTHGDTVLDFLQSPPQTNEVARAAALAGGFLTITAFTSLPLALLEIGASAGLNLHWDKFGYDLGGLGINKATARPLLAPVWQGPPPPGGDVVVQERMGCDRTPIDVRSADDVLRLRAYVWADQTDRQTRLDQGLAVARAAPVSLARADAADWAETRLAQRRDNVATVLFHSIVWQYIAGENQQRLRRIIDAAGRRADAASPFAWLRMEPETTKAAALRLTLWPDGSTLVLADVDYHGRWITWHGVPSARP